MTSPRRRTNPLRPGVSAAGISCAAGTLSAIVHDSSGRPFLLGAWHAFVGLGGIAGHPVLQQSPADGGMLTTHLVGRAVRWVCGPAGDAAIATVIRRTTSNQVFGRQVTLRGTRKPFVGQVLEKQGRSTGLTRAVVASVGTVKTAWVTAGCSGFRLVPLPGDHGEISKPGDSGAIWYDPSTGAGVGIHLEGELQGHPEQAIAGDLTTALAALGVSLS